jgi:hypothetical protein
VDSEYRPRFFKAKLVDVDSGDQRLVLVEYEDDEESARSRLTRMYGDAYRISQLQELDDPGSRTCRECGSRPAQTWMQQPHAGPILPVCVDCQEQIQHRKLGLLQQEMDLLKAQRDLAVAEQQTHRPGILLKVAALFALLFGALFG